MKRCIDSLCCALFAFAFDATGFSAESEQVQGHAERFPVLRRFNDECAANLLALSPDGKQLAYCLQDWSRHTAPEQLPHPRCASIWFTELHVLDPVSGADVRVTDSTYAAVWSPAWSPNGERLSFFAHRDGAAGIWLWEPGWSEARRVGDVRAVFKQAPAFSGERLSWSGDGRLLAKLHAGLSGVTYDFKMAKEIAPREQGVGFAVFKGSEGLSLDSEYQSRLGVVEVVAGTSRWLDESLSMPFWFGWSANDNFVAVQRLLALDKPSSTLRGLPTEVVVFKVAPEKTETRVVGSLGADTHPAWSPRGDKLAWVAGDSVTLHEVKTGATRVVKIGGGGKLRVTTSPGWSDDGTRLLLLAENGDVHAAGDSEATRVVAALPKEGKLVTGHNGQWISVTGSTLTFATSHSGELRFHTITEGRAGETSKVSGIPSRLTQVLPDLARRRVFFIGQDARHESNLYVADASGAMPSVRHLTTLNPALAHAKLGKQTLLDVKREGKPTLKATLWLPADHQDGQPLPLVLDVYPSGYHGRGFRDQFVPVAQLHQALCASGFAVLACDMPDAEDWLAITTAAIDAAENRDVVDRQRLGVMGHSNGGWAVMKLITETDIFRAAVCRSGFADWFAYAGFLKSEGEDYGFRNANNFDWLGTPWANFDAYVNASPYLRLDKVKTPLLLTHGTADEAVPSYCADQIFTGLRKLGKDVEYARYDGASHKEWYWPAPQQADAMQRIIKWFENYLKTR